MSSKEMLISAGANGRCQGERESTFFQALMRSLSRATQNAGSVRTFIPTSFLTVVALIPSVAYPDYSLTIIHTNDFHSRFLPIDLAESDCPDEKAAEGKCFGGSARLMTAINDARSRAENWVLLDAGDQFPHPNHPVSFPRSLAADLMNEMRYDAMTLGNHEFDEGPAVLSDFIDRVNFPVLVANVDFSSTPLLKGKTKKSTVIERSGEKIGLIGVTLQSNAAWSVYYPNIKTISMVDAVQFEIDELRGRDVNKIILISHLGYPWDRMLAMKTEGLDVIVGGHSHKYLSSHSEDASGPYPTMVNGVAIVQAYAFGAFLGVLDVTFDDEGNVIKALGDPILLDQSVAEDEEIRSQIGASADPR